MVPEECNYQLEFEDIKLGYSLVTVRSVQNPEPQKYRVYVNDNGIGTRTVEQVPANISDMIDLGIAVFTADRILNSHARDRLLIHVILPIRCPGIMNSEMVMDLLQNTLAQYTEHVWHFTFKQREGDERAAAWQQAMPLKISERKEIALWSSGVDALAGFLIRISDEPEKHFVLFGTGSNTNIHRQQSNLRRAVEQQYPASTTLVRLPYSVRKIDLSLSSKPLLRSRGFTFILLGAACAYLHEQRELHIYENGPGAINLPFRESELGLDHSRAVHPLSLQYMSELITAILDEPFELVNPFLFSTKAQMCEIFRYGAHADLITDTITCDHVHRNKLGQSSMQCGRCSSCILRRQALAAAGIHDDTRYVYEAFFLDSVESVCTHDHLPAMIYQVENLRRHLNTASVWEALRQQYPTLSFDVVDRASQHIKLKPQEIIENLIGLYRQYVFEWDLLKEGSHGQRYLS